MSRLSSLQSKLLLVFFSSVIAFVATTFYIVQKAAYEQSTVQFQQQLSAAINVLEYTVETEFDALEASMKTLAKDFSTKQLIVGAKTDAESLKVALQNHQQRLGADIALVTSPEGKLLSSSLNGQLEVDQQLLAEGKQSLMQWQQRFYLVRAVPVSFVEASKKVNAWLMMGISIERLLEERLTDLTSMDVGFVIDAAGNQQLLASTTPLPDLADKPFILDDEINTFDWSDQVYYYATHQFSSNTMLALRSVLFIQKERVYLSYNELLWQIAFILAAAGAVIFIFATLIGTGIAKPLKNLVNVANRINQGDYSNQIISTSMSEVAVLADAFSNMREGIAQREKAIQKLAYYDPLTELPNRNSFTENLSTALAGAGSHTPLALLMIDVDRFKEINDTIGHAKGDQLLQLIAERLASVSNEKVFLSHMGADEFAVLLSEVDAFDICAQLKVFTDLFDEPFDLGGVSLAVDISVGVAIYPEHGESAHKLLQKADIALNHCKNSHVAYVLFESSMDKFSLQRLNLMSDLKVAIAENQLQVHFQPKIDLASGTVMGVESLVRWIHPVHGFLPPDEFIAMAEQTGVIRELTKWIIRQVLVTAQQWRKQGIAIKFAVNVSAVDLVDMKLPHYVSGLLDELQCTPEQLVIEVTESALMSDVDCAMKSLNLLQDMGLKISIDDFGTGYSSMEKLKTMPVDELKIDRSFVMDIVESNEDKAIVKTIIALAHNLGLSVVAEGIESAEIVTMLKQLHCDIAQGYHYSKPLPAADFVLWYEEFQELQPN